MDLSKFKNEDFDRGASKTKEFLWRVTSAFFFQNPLCFHYGLKRVILRFFGAEIGKGVLIKPRVTITFPWKLKIGAHSWIGEAVWLDSLDQIDIGSNACISQGAYLCTGSHDYRSNSFDLIVKPLKIENSVWIGAFSKIAPGLIVREGSIIQIGSNVLRSTTKNMVHGGNPAKTIRER